MNRMIQSDNFALADLGLVLLCAVAWAILPQLGWVILVISLVPWALRLIYGVFPFRRTRLDLPIGAFLITAGVGVWAAYDPTNAWEKFWWIVAACRLYYALAAQPKENFQTAAILIAAIAGLLSIQFLLTFNWQEHPLLGPVDRVGQLWMEFRPTVKLPMPEPDFIGGLTAILTPLTLLLVIDAYKQGKKRLFGLILAINFFLALGLLMSGERPAWVGLFLTAGFWAGWQLCKWISHRINQSPITIAIALFTISAVSGIVLIGLTWGRLTSLGSGRIEEIINGSQLVLAYPLLGGGLTSVPGLYSRYILNIQYLYIPYLSNQYLNIAIEQGLLGFSAFLLIVTGSLVMLSGQRKPEFKPFHSFKWAITAGILILGFHSLVENVFYSNWSVIFLFILPGLAVILLPESMPFRLPLKWIFVIVGVISVAVMFFVNPLRSIWYANLGAVQMAQVQLRGWPEQRITSQALLSQITPAETSLKQALKFQGNQPTANYHLGLIATERQEFNTANAYLSIAFDQRPLHRGIRKALGYSFAWLGDTKTASTILGPIPEAPYELGIYAEYWENENRLDLSMYAVETKNWIEP